MTKSRATEARTMKSAVPPLKVTPPEPDAALVAQRLRTASKLLANAANEMESRRYLPPPTEQEVVESMPHAVARHGLRGDELLAALETTRDAMITLEDATGGLFALLRERDGMTGLRMASLARIGKAWRSKRTREATESGNMARELARWGLIDPDDRDSYTPSRKVVALAAARMEEERATASDG